MLSDNTNIICIAVKHDRKVHQRIALLPVSKFYIFRQCAYIVYLCQVNNVIVSDVSCVLLIYPHSPSVCSMSRADGLIIISGIALLPDSKFYIFRQCTYIVYLSQVNNLIVFCMIKVKQELLFACCMKENYF
jgi:hypothetical protein